MAAVAHSITSKTKKKSTLKKPTVRQSVAPEVVSPPTPRVTRGVAVTKGRATAKMAVSSRVSPLKEVETQVTKAKGQSVEKKPTQQRKKKSVPAKVKSTTVKAQQLLIEVPPTVAKTRTAKAKTPEVALKPPQKSKKRRRKAVVKPKTEMTTVSTTSTVSKKSAAPLQQKTAKVSAKQPAVRDKRVMKPGVKDATATVKARRVRAPKDLAAQYGESETKTTKRRGAESAETKRARRDAALRQKMRDAMEVGDDLIARLQRAGMIAGSDEPDAKNGHNGHGTKRILGSRVLRRPRKWEARCGKCGNRSLFKTAAGLCAKCGAIMVRE